MILWRAQESSQQLSIDAVIGELISWVPQVVLICGQKNDMELGMSLVGKQHTTLKKVLAILHLVILEMPLYKHNFLLALSMYNWRHY